MPATEAQIQARWEPAVDAYRGFIKATAYQNFYCIPGYEADDLETELYEVLWIATRTYEPDKGAKFNTYWQTLWRRRIADLIRYHSYDKRKSNMYTEELDEAAVNLVSQEYSAEDEALSRIIVHEHLQAGRKPK